VLAANTINYIINKNMTALSYFDLHKTYPIIKASSKRDCFVQRTKDSKVEIIMNDILIPDEEGIKNDKIFNHVAIDRFTGGAMDGALFSEKVSYFEDENKEVCIDIWLEKTEFSEKVINAFEETLKDVCKGLLPLGGMTTKGHGIFTGKLLKDSKEEFNYEN